MSDNENIDIPKRKVGRPRKHADPIEAKKQYDKQYTQHRRDTDDDYKQRMKEYRKEYYARTKK